MTAAPQTAPSLINPAAPSGHLSDRIDRRKVNFESMKTERCLQGRSKVSKAADEVRIGRDDVPRSDQASPACGATVWELAGFLLVNNSRM